MSKRVISYNRFTMTMIEDFYHHLVHYLVLIFILLGGLILYLFFNHQPERQWIVAQTTAFLYILWGIGHHWVTDKRIYLKVVVEYVLISLIGLILVKGVLFL